MRIAQSMSSHMHIVSSCARVHVAFDVHAEHRKEEDVAT